MSLIGTPEPGEKVERGYRIRQYGGLTLSDVLSPVVMVDDFSGASVLDTGYPRDAIGNVSVGAVAAEFGSCSWRPPAGMVGELHGLILHEGGTHIYQIRSLRGVAITAGGTPSVTKAFMDTRIPGLPVTALQGDTAAASQGVLVADIRMLANVTLWVPLRFVASLDDQGRGGVNITHATANDSMTVTFVWTEHLNPEN